MVQNLNRQTHQTQASLDNDVGEPPQVAQAAETLASMSELDRFGLTGLLHMIRSEGSDIGSLAIGQDLTALGLDLNQPEYARDPLVRYARLTGECKAIDLSIIHLHHPSPSLPQDR